jgi:hypothetical protein
LATQIGSNYLNGIFNDGYIPYRGGNPDYVYSNYLGTKFLVSLILGCEFELLKHTFIEIGAGLGVRDIKVKYLSEKIQDRWFVTFDSQLKLSYKFPVE